MKKSSFTDAHVAFILRQAEDGTAIGEVCRKAGIRNTPVLMPSEMKRLSLHGDVPLSTMFGRVGRFRSVGLPGAPDGDVDLPLQRQTSRAGRADQADQRDRGDPRKDGYRRVHVLLRREGWGVNAKRIYRLYKELGLQLRNKTPKRRVKAPAAR
jgi:hypothetical protein